MAALQKFRLLATQCTTASSPSRSPAAPTPVAAPPSPSIRLRRRRTLRKLLSRSPSRRLPRRGEAAGRRRTEGEEEEQGLLGHTLRDLFVSSPPQLDGRELGPEMDRVDSVARRFELEAVGAGFGGRRGGSAPRRFGSAGLRHRLLRRAWRPVLVAIPE